MNSVLFSWLILQSISQSPYTWYQSLVLFAYNKSDLLPVSVGLLQDWSLSPVLFLTFMNRISRHSRGVKVSSLRGFRLHCFICRWYEFSLFEPEPPAVTAGMEIGIIRSGAMVLPWPSTGRLWLANSESWMRCCIKQKSSCFLRSWSWVEVDWGQCWL